MSSNSVQRASQPIVLITLLVTTLLSGCTEPGQLETSLSKQRPLPENRSVVTRWKLPKALREVSGLAIHPSGSLYAVADEKAAIYRINPVSGEVESVYALGKPTLTGDFEGIALHGGWLYLVTSNGTLVRTRGAPDGEIATFETYKLPIACELEGLATDPEHPLLWLVCKSFNDDSLSTKTIRLHAWSVTEQKILPKRQLNLDLPSALRLTGQHRFKPSGIAFLPDPEGWQLIVISGAQRAFTRWRWSKDASQLIDAARLPEAHKQAEGIEIAHDGGVLIADEGGNKRARLRRYAPGELF